jgi:hypothetical protein
MMYEERPVREIQDYITGIFISESAGSNGFGGRNILNAVDLTAIYEDGILVGLKISTQEEYDLRTKEREDANIAFDSVFADYNRIEPHEQIAVELESLIWESGWRTVNWDEIDWNRFEHEYFDQEEADIWRNDLLETLREYARFGLTVDDESGNVYYNDMLVEYFHDSYLSDLPYRFSRESGIYVYAVRSVANSNSDRELLGLAVWDGK